MGAADQRYAGGQQAADQVDLGDFERLSQAHRRQDRWHRMYKIAEIGYQAFSPAAVLVAAARWRS